MRTCNNSNNFEYDFKKWHSPVIMLAPTGIAAFNIYRTTIQQQQQQQQQQDQQHPCTKQYGWKMLEHKSN